MSDFESIFEKDIVGKLTIPDRMILKGHLTTLFGTGAFAAFLARVGVLLKDFKDYMPTVSKAIKGHAMAVAEKAGRPFIYLEQNKTMKKGETKESFARSIAHEDGITEGLVCVLSALEPCMSYSVRGNRAEQKLEAVRSFRKCLHLYYYFIDPEFGFMHIRVQTWAPFEIQFYVNGREWLCRQLDKENIGYTRYENAILSVDNVARAQELCRKFRNKKWTGFLDKCASMVNPYLTTVKQAGFRSYYFCIDQCEVATDVLFGTRASLRSLLPDLINHSIQQTTPKDVLKFFGRKVHGNLKAQVTTDYKQRPVGARVKHRVGRNSIKMYDKWSVLRIETTINNPRDFKVAKYVASKTQPSSDASAPGNSGHQKGRKLEWGRMNKGISNLWRYIQIGEAANDRYLDYLSAVKPTKKALRQLDRLSTGCVVNGKRVPKFNPVSAIDCNAFAAVLAGTGLLNGIRNRDLAAVLYPPPKSKRAASRNRNRVSRLIAKFRGHGLLKKVPRCRMYRVTKRGISVMTAALRFRHQEFPDGFAAHQDSIRIQLCAAPP